MAGTKVSLLNNATDLQDTDVLYIVNNSNPRKLSLGALNDYVLTNTGAINVINGVNSINNAITLTKSNIGLSNVPNISPVTSINTFNGNLQILGSTQEIDIDNTGSTITLSINPNFSLDFSKITGTWQDQPSVSSALSSVGVQSSPISLNANTSLVLDNEHSLCLWVDCNFQSNTAVLLSDFNPVIGTLIELRQAGLGTVTVQPLDGNEFIFYPYGTWSHTNGIGTRIQIVCIGNNHWEFK